MARFERNNVLLHADCETVYGFLGDFRNMEELMPDKVIDWKAEEGACSFTIEGMADLAMRMDSKNHCKNIHIVSEGKTPVSFTLDYFFREKGGGECSVDIVFEVSLNPFLKTVASGPLQHLVDLMAEKLQQRYSGS